MKYCLEQIPFSRYGSYFAISQNQSSGRLYLRDLHGGEESRADIYEMVFRGYEKDGFVLERTESEISWYHRNHPQIWLKAAIEQNGAVHFLVHGMDLELHATGGGYDTLVPLSREQLEHHLYKQQIKMMFTCCSGAIKQSQCWEIVGSKEAVIRLCGKTEAGDDTVTHCVLESYRCVWKKRAFPSYEDVEHDARQSYETWQSLFPNEGGTFEESRRLAAYLTWINVVSAQGCLTAPAMYMSKNWMLNIWSWDHCFGGIALSSAQPQLAWGQLKIFIDNQDESGTYADYINDEMASFNCVKPPIHAWAYKKMMEQHEFFRRQDILTEAYESFCRVTRYWLDYRRNPMAVMPVYYHGNDSGWDNASVFHQGFPVESPDLSAFLIYQMDVLSQMAQKLGRVEEACEWNKIADEMFEKFMKRFYLDCRFFSWHIPSNQRITGGDSLLMYLPVVIAYRMEGETARHLVDDMLRKFETPYGMATENPESPYYKKGGYWLGPVWAPVTYILIDALREHGYKDAAHRLANKFCHLTVKGLMSENYDPFTGQGYDDPAFAWPSCVLLQLLREYHDLK